MSFCFTITHCIFIIAKIVGKKSGREKRSTHFMPNNFFATILVFELIKKKRGKEDMIIVML
jgi:hypothetical protein